jgi:hypothetical protein
MSDNFYKVGDMPGYSSKKLIAITPSNLDLLPIVTKAIFIGTGGTVSILAQNDTVPVTLTVGSGAILPIRAKAVFATGTTATGIIGLL